MSKIKEPNLSFLIIFLIIILFITPVYPNSKDIVCPDSTENSNPYPKGHKWYNGQFTHRVPYRHIVTLPIVPDTADEKYHERKNFWRAGAEVIGFEWDNDHLNTNMFAHPYNGSLYYNAGRSRG